MTACPDRIAQMDALFLGDLSEQEAEALRAHVAGCEGCRAYHDRLWKVEAALERRAMPARAAASLEARLLAHVAQAPQVAPAPPAPPAKPAATWLERLRALWAEQPWLRVGAPLAAAAALAVLVVALPDRPGTDPNAGLFRPRGNGSAPAFGVRAYCIGSAATVTGEARPGERLTCPEGSSIQLSVTAPEPAKLTAVATTQAGESHDLARDLPVGPGIDAPLPFSTPSRKAWLGGPTRLTVRFESAAG
ncbi:MAG TPA: zf-HC2 domain-containing protein, partial [Myxococcales bacterium]|nr:zf-HC2 domain-containing protein [Myxococcales bacterium]